MFFMFVAIMLHSQQSDNSELKEMARQDQLIRETGPGPGQNIHTEDSLRRVRLHQMIAEGKLVTSNDHFNAALIFQHGDGPEDSHQAVVHMKIATELDPLRNKWLLAAAIDRDLMRNDKPQIYGTQFVNRNDGMGWILYEVDTGAVTDSERAAYNVPPLDESILRAARMNMRSIFELPIQRGQGSAICDEIQKQDSLGVNAAYDVSMMEIDAFAKSWLKMDLNNDAILIYELNTVLHPCSFTYNNLGNCLEKCGKKMRARRCFKWAGKFDSE